MHRRPQGLIGAAPSESVCPHTRLLRRPQWKTNQNSQSCRADPGMRSANHPCSQKSHSVDSWSGQDFAFLTCGGHPTQTPRACWPTRFLIYIHWQLDPASLTTHKPAFPMVLLSCPPFAKSTPKAGEGFQQPLPLNHTSCQQPLPLLNHPSSLTTTLCILPSHR